MVLYPFIDRTQVFTQLCLMLPRMHKIMPSQERLIKMTKYGLTRISYAMPKVKPRTGIHYIWLGSYLGFHELADDFPHPRLCDISIQSDGDPSGSMKTHQTVQGMISRHLINGAVPSLGLSH
jgi:hypothetical protein